jgi:small subunit ribosomal protein S17e
VDRIKRISYEVLEEHKSMFGEDFADNKKVLDQISIIRSKSLKNKISGYITRLIKKEIRDEKVKQAQIESSQSEEPIEKEVQAETPEPTIVSEETPTETLVETTPVEEKTETIAEKTE